ncbi:MAG: hypothetical protein Q7W45_07175 [Bacteroidota bacterium]|nr:hypothetical protein [Bacteroidota bacterium]MDP3143922.1 hypothetical protein [Bacteroidota bacterium]MDP3557580.1 hypothetical protein [Bacteroidota bacterium]
MKNYFKLLIILFAINNSFFAQIMPSPDENIPFLVTFSKSSDKTWGDDDNIQIYFFAIPQDIKTPFYIRVFDPDNGGKHDENRNGFNSKTKFSVYGGKGAHSNEAAKGKDPKGNYNSGILLNTKTFGDDPQYDDKWYNFGPLNPTEGELQPEMGYVFKLVVEGAEGDDGNLYRLSLSSQKDDNVKVEGGNILTYEYCFRTSDAIGSVSHLYPFVTKGIVSITIDVFDYDDEGLIRIISVSKKGENTKLEKSENREISKHTISDEEINTSLDVQFIKNKASKNNNITVSIANQYGVSLPFYTVPIGGVPKYKYKIKVSK